MLAGDGRGHGDSRPQRSISLLEKDFGSSGLPSRLPTKVQVYFVAATAHAQPLGPAPSLMLPSGHAPAGWGFFPFAANQAEARLRTGPASATISFGCLRGLRMRAPSLGPTPAHACLLTRLLTKHAGQFHRRFLFSPARGSSASAASPKPRPSREPRPRDAFYPPPPSCRSSEGGRDVVPGHTAEREFVCLVS